MSEKKDIARLDEDGNLEYSAWVTRGAMIVRRTALDFRDVDSIPRLWARFYGERMPDSVCSQLWGHYPTPTERAKLDVAFAIELNVTIAKQLWDDSGYGLEETYTG